MKFADRLKFTATGTNAATIADGTALAKCRNIATVISDGGPIGIGDINVPFIIEDSTGAWEDSLFTVGLMPDNVTPKLTRTQVLASSAGGTNPATFNGTITVYNTVPGKILSRVTFDSDVPFSQTVPLTQPGTAWMPQQAVNGPLNFTPAASAVKGAFAYVRLVADGVNAPTFSGFTEEIGSAGYDNRNGIVNRIQFAYDGADYWFAISQAANAVALASALTLSASAASTYIGSPVTVTVGVNSPLTGSQTETVTLAAPVAGTWSTNPVTLSASAQTVAAAFTPSAAGSGSITATASGSPNLTGANVAYSASAAPAEQLNVNTPATQTVGAAFTVSGTYANATPTALDYRLSDDATGQWTPATTALLIGNGAYSFSITPASTSAGRTISVRDHNNTGATATSGSYAVTAADTTPPTFSSAQVANATPTVIQITMSETLANSVPPASAWTVSGGKTVTGVSIAGPVISLTCSAAYANGDTIAATYAQPAANPRLQDAAGNVTAGFGPVSVTNNVTAAAVDYPRLSSATMSTTQTESGTGPYTYTGTAGQTISTEKGGVTTKSLASGADGWIEFQVMSVGDASSGAECGFRMVNSPNTFGSQNSAGFYTSGQSGSGPAYYRMTGGGNLMAAAAGDIIRYCREGGVTKCYVRVGGGATLTPLFTDTAVTGQAWFDVVAFGSASVKLIAWNNVT